MNVTIEHPFCPYCSEVTNLYFRIINTLLFSKDEDELRTSMEHLKKETPLDEYFTFGYGAHHLWICQRKPSDKNKIFPHRIMMIQFWHGASALYGLELNIQFQPVTLFTAITFYTPNFIESQMAIGRTMIFVDYPFICSFGCAISIYKEAETCITRPFRFVSPIRIQPFFILPSFPSFLLPDKDCNTDTPTPLCQFFVLRPFPPRSLYAYCLYGVSSLPLQIMRSGTVSRLKFFF